MKTMQHIRFGSLCCALFLAGSAYAEQQISSHEFTSALTSEKPGSPSSEVLLVPGFDPALGTLTGVSIQVEIGMDGTWAVENLDNKERIEMVGGGARVSLFAGPNGSKRKLTGATSGNQAVLNFANFDGVADCRGSSANQSPFSSQTSKLVKLEPNDFWVKTSNPNGAPLSVSLLSQFVHPVDMIGCIQADAKIAIRVDYHYDDGSKGFQVGQGPLTSRTPEPIHAWREERESPIA
jgi:hypothetical protein